MKLWNDLSLAEKGDIMKVAVRNGIKTLPEIRQAYNEFAEGGSVGTDGISDYTEGNLYGGGSYMEQAKSLIRKNEGWSAKPYKDAPTGRTWRSVGYGFNDSGFRDKYPEGISKHYEHGITRAQAEEELSHYLGKAERTLRGIYGKQWNAFTDGQKAAILDTYYQRPASVGKGSAFYKAVKSGKDATNYLGVNGYEKRNKGRREAFSGTREIPVTMQNMDVVMNSPIPVQESIDFIPLNPQVFGMQIPSIQAPATIVEQPIVEMAHQQVPTPEQLERERVLQERQERRDRLDKFNLLMSLSSPQQDNGMLGAVGMLTGNQFGGGGKKSSAKRFNQPQTFAGRVAQVLGASPKTVRGWDVASASVGITPYGIIPSTLDLGYDLNRAVHGEDGAIIDAGLDVLSMLPGVSKVGLKTIKPKNLVDAAKQKYDSVLQSARNTVNTILGAAKTTDYVSDTYGANRASHALGGNIFDGTSEGSQQMERPNIYRYDDGRYVYQAAPDAEEIEVTPINTLLPNPSQWTYQDASGKIYTPHTAQVNTGSITQGEDSNPLVRAANNYFREATYRAKDGTLALQGKYTMPAIATIAAAPFLTWAGEAAYPYVSSTLSNPYVDAGLTSAFGAHGVNHIVNEGVNSWGDATMTALEVAPLGRLARPVYEGIVQPGMRLFNSPLTGNWTKIGNREYRLNPNSLGANGSPLESRTVTPQITAENAASMTPEQWTAAQDAAIARGDMAEAQRLRDLHFKVAAPNTKYITEDGLPKVATHGTNKQFNSFKLEGPDVVHRDPGDFGYGHYFYPWDGKSSYGDRQIRAYLNMERPYIGDWSRNFNRTSYDEKRMLFDMIQARSYGLTDMTTGQMFDELNKLRTADGVIAVSPYSKKPLEVVVPKGEQIKLADAVTYDNNGVRIPLGERDNFNINDIRYGLLPFLGLGAAGTLYGKQE